MTPFETFLENLTNVNPWGIAKFCVLVFLVTYITFAVVVVRQVQLMAKTLDGSFNWALLTMALIHLGFAIFIFFLALIIL